MSKYFPDTKSSRERLRVELDLSNYVKKAVKKRNKCSYIKIW